jgi:D-galactarolactone cycloisomerase
MKITALKPRSLHARLAAPMRSRGDVGFTEFFHTGSEVQRITALEIHTDTEHTGVTLLGGDARAWVAAVAAPALVGQDPRAIRRLRAALARDTARVQINRLEFGLWDLLAKRAGIPLWRLLGGTDPHVRVYAGGGSLCWNPLPLLVEETQALVARGFRALKIKIGHGPEEDAEIIRAVRTAAPDLQIMVDANRAYDLDSALRLCRTLEEQNVYWFEEPLVYDAPEPWRRLRAGTSVKITGGEGFSRLAQVADALREEIVGVLQCDAGGFGLEALLAIASMAAEAGVALTPHSCNSVIGFVVACHMQPALPNPEVQEFETFDSPFIHRLFSEPFRLTEGCVRLSEAPGLGVTLNEETLGRFGVRD